MQHKIVQQYIWQEPSPIREADIVPLQKGMHRARLFAREGTEPGTLANLSNTLHRYGISGAYADTYKGQNVLVVPSFQDPQKLLNVLQSSELTKGEPKLNSIKGEAEAEISAYEQIRKDALKLHGAAGLFGHAAVFASGWLQKDYARMALGPLSAAPAGIMAMYGNGVSDMDFDTMLTQMSKYFEEEGIDLPPLDLPEAKKSIFKDINNYISQHAIPIAFGIGSLGSVSAIKAGIHDFTHSQPAPGKKGLLRPGVELMVLGTFTLLSNMIKIFVPERQKTQAERNHSKNQSWGQWFSEKANNAGYYAVHPLEIPSATWSAIRKDPMFVAGSMDLADNCLWFVNALRQKGRVEEWKTKNPGVIADKMAEIDKLKAMSIPGVGNGLGSYGEKIGKLTKEVESLTRDHNFANSPNSKYLPLLTFTTAFSYIIASSMTALSSKNRDDSALSTEHFDRLYALVAKVMVNIDPARREDMLTRMATYLSARDDLKEGNISAEKLVSEVRRRIPLLEKSPFNAPNAETAAWQAKMAQAANSNMAHKPAMGI